jgi:uncharacterized protein involved in exopolysaccharide biosynthesis
MNGPSETTTPRPASNDIDFRDLVRTLWSWKWLIAGIAFAASVIAALVSLLLPDIYRSDTLLAPNNAENSSGIAALTSQYAGLASLAGINLDQGEIDKTALGLEILKSRRFISNFIAQHNILVPLMAADGWELSTGDLTIDPDIFDVETGEWVRDVSPPKTTIPSSQEAHEEFIEILSIDQDQATGFVTIAIEHYSPVLARQWLEWLIQDLNHYVMQRDVAEAEQAIGFLNKQIANTSLANLQSVFFSLIEEHTKTVMLANMTDEYLFTVVDPPVEPDEKAKPRRLLIVILSSFLGLILAVIFVLTFESMKQRNKP